MEACVPLGQGFAFTTGRMGLMSASMKTPAALPNGVWQGLLQHAYSLFDEIEVHGIRNPFWTFGGGTVLMLRYRHRMSKDIDAMNDATLWLSVSTVLAQVLGPLPIRGLDWDGSLSQRCSTLAFMPCALATAAMDAPGALQAANNSALVSGEYVRLVRRTAYLGVSESLSIVSTINCCGHNVARSGVTQQGDFARRLPSAHLRAIPVDAGPVRCSAFGPGLAIDKIRVQNPKNAAAMR